MRLAVMFVADLVMYLVLGLRCAWSVLRETLPDTSEEGDAFIAGMLWMSLIVLVCLGVAGWAATAHQGG